MPRQTRFSNNLFALWVIVSVATGLLSLLACRNNNDSNYAFPGNGIPYFSKNLPITQLDAELSAYASAFANIETRNGRLLFSNLKDFHFRSKKGFGDRPISAQVELRIYSGYCILALDSVSIKIAADSFIIEDEDRTIYGPKQAKIEQVAFTRYSSGAKVAISIYADDQLLDTIQTSLIDVHRIKLDLTQGARGFLGPWIWIRGRE
jgi:hypothetical protein